MRVLRRYVYLDSPIFSGISANEFYQSADTKEKNEKSQKPQIETSAERTELLPIGNGSFYSDVQYPSFFDKDGESPPEVCSIRWLKSVECGLTVSR